MLGMTYEIKEKIMSQWWVMHGYGGYIWSAYSLVLGVLFYNAYCAWARSKQVFQRLNQWFNGQ